jgi:glycosyltransferase involved in cell wall biosynthesis
MKISIAMCTYNGAKYIAEQLESLSRQSVMPLELVVCDDGSTDNTLEIINEFASRLPFEVRVYKNEENLHFTGNFLKAASLCAGDAIAFCDQDDIWDSTKIETCSKALESGRADLLIHEGRVVDGDGWPTSMKIPNLTGKLASINKAPFDQVSKGFAMVVRRQVIDELMVHWDWNDYIEFKRVYGPPLGHDLFVYAWCFEKRKIAFLQKELVQYRVHGGNVTAGAAIAKSRASRLAAFFRGLTLDKSSYSLPGHKWAAEVQYLKAYLMRCGPERHPGLQQLLEWLDRKSRLWILRADIYDRNLGRLMRWNAVAAILFMGGYVSFQDSCLGFNSLIKDMAVAIFFGNKTNEN